MAVRGNGAGKRLPPVSGPVSAVCVGGLSSAAASPWPASSPWPVFLGTERPSRSVRARCLVSRGALLPSGLLFPAALQQLCLGACMARG